jgi:hypothetical protein
MSPTPSELVKKYQADAEIAQKKAQADALKREGIQMELRRREQREAEIQQRQRLDNEKRRKEIVRNKNWEIMNVSGLMAGVKDIEQSCLQSVKKHDFVYDADKGEMVLVWGNKYSMEGTKIETVPVKLLFFIDASYGEIDCSSIQCSVNPDSEAITINSKIIEKNLWMNNHDVIDSSIAAAYMNPVRQHFKEEPPSYDSYSSTSTTNSECCNS